MNREEFLVHMQDILQTDEELSFDMNLDDLEEWDSLSKMATVAFLDANFGVKTTFPSISNELPVSCLTISS